VKVLKIVVALLHQLYYLRLREEESEPRISADIVNLHVVLQMFFPCVRYANAQGGAAEID